jgi:hypothetical protein
MEQLKGILFIDIETVPMMPDYSLLPERMQAEWNRKSKFVKGSNDEITDPATLSATGQVFFPNLQRWFASVSVACNNRITP